VQASCKRHKDNFACWMGTGLKGGCENIL